MEKTIKFKLKGDWRSKSVWLNDRAISPGPSLKRRNHSPDGFNWGYGGSGPAQLALAICMELFGDKAFDYQEFKFRHIASLPQSDFEVTIEAPENGYIDNQQKP